MPGEKFVTPEVWEKILTQTKSPIPRSSTKVKHQGWARSGFDTFVDVIRQQNGWRAFIMWWFSRLEFCISRLKTRR